MADPFGEPEPQWTSEQPIEPGYYWLKWRVPSDEALVVEVQWWGPGDLRVEFMGTRDGGKLADSVYSDPQLVLWWPVPIPPPPGASQFPLNKSEHRKKWHGRRPDLSDEEIPF